MPERRWRRTAVFCNTVGAGRPGNAIQKTIVPSKTGHIIPRFSSYPGVCRMLKRGPFCLLFAVALALPCLAEEKCVRYGRRRSQRSEVQGSHRRSTARAGQKETRKSSRRDGEVHPVYIKNLRSKDADERTSACNFLAELNAAEATPELIDVLRPARRDRVPFSAPPTERWCESPARTLARPRMPEWNAWWMKTAKRSSMRRLTTFPRTNKMMCRKRRRRASN